MRSAHGVFIGSIPKVSKSILSLNLKAQELVKEISKQRKNY